MKIKHYGVRVRDSVTGIQGVVTAVAYYYAKSPTMYRIEYVTKSGERVEDWIEEERLLFSE